MSQRNGVPNFAPPPTPLRDVEAAGIRLAVRTAVTPDEARRMAAAYVVHLRMCNRTLRRRQGGYSGNTVILAFSGGVLTAVAYMALLMRGWL